MDLLISAFLMTQKREDVHLYSDRSVKDLHGSRRQDDSGRVSLVVLNRTEPFSFLSFRIQHKFNVKNRRKTICYNGSV